MRKKFLWIANLAVAALALFGLVETRNGLVALASTGVFFSEFLFFWRRVGREVQAAVKPPAIGEDERNARAAARSQSG